jgi:plasmid stabilization system protein ParE
MPEVTLRVSVWPALTRPGQRMMKDAPFQLVVLAAAEPARVAEHVVGEFLRFLLRAEEDRRGPVVAGKDDDGVLAQTEFIEGRQQAFDVLVDGPDIAEVLPHGGVDIAADLLAFVELLLHGRREVLAVHLDMLETVLQIGMHVDGIVRGVAPDVHIEGFVGVGLDEPDRVVEQARVAAAR